MATFLCNAWYALRMRASISAIGSVTDMSASYQLDFLTPGNSPARAMLRKQIRQMPYLRKNARARPQMGQRL